MIHSNRHHDNHENHDHKSHRCQHHAIWILQIIQQQTFLLVNLSFHPPLAPIFPACVARTRAPRSVAPLRWPPKNGGFRSIFADLSKSYLVGGWTTQLFKICSSNWIISPRGTTKHHLAAVDGSEILHQFMGSLSTCPRLDTSRFLQQYALLHPNWILDISTLDWLFRSIHTWLDPDQQKCAICICVFVI